MTSIHPIEVWTGGQTGVDMGAALAALHAGAPLGGFMPRDGRNEDGPIPPHVARHLIRHHRPGPAARTEANVDHADVVLVIVEDGLHPGKTRGTALTVRLAGERENRGDCRLVVADRSWAPGSWSGWQGMVAQWLAGVPHLPLRLLVAGPRASRWQDGHRIAYGIVTAVLRAADERCTPLTGDPDAR